MKKLSKKTKFGCLFLFVVAAFALQAPLMPGLDPNAFDPNLVGSPQAPGLGNFFGTDDLGRDLLVRSAFGARISMMVALVSVSISLFIGIAVGLISGYAGGRVDELLMRVVDLFMAVPTLFLILTIQVILTPSLMNIMIVIGCTSWMGMSRLVRAEVMSIKNRPFILAGKARGLSRNRLVLKHLLPHTLNPIIVAAMLGMGDAILTESVLSFLGLGVQPPNPSWGNMLQDSLAYMIDAPWMTIVPGTLITLTVLSLNFIGDGLRAYIEKEER